MVTGPKQIDGLIIRRDSVEQDKYRAVAARYEMKILVPFRISRIVADLVVYFDARS